MILSFKCKETQKIFKMTFSRKLPENIQKTALRKLKYLSSAVSLEDLRVPPNNRLEALTGDRAGQHSIRINRQFRICFRRQNGNALDVEIVDYH